MLSRVGRARGLLCVFLFMPFSNNGLPKVTVRPRPGTEPSMHNIRRSIQSRFCSGNSRAPSERNSCRKAEFFPLSNRKVQHRRKQSMSLRSVVGAIRLEVWHGQDPGDKHWGCPLRERWGLRAHQQMSPVLEEKLAFTVTLSSSYEAAAQ